MERSEHNNNWQQQHLNCTSFCVWIIKNSKKKTADSCLEMSDDVCRTSSSIISNTNHYLSDSSNIGVFANSLNEESKQSQPLNKLPDDTSKGELDNPVHWVQPKLHRPIPVQIFWSKEISKRRLKVVVLQNFDGWNILFSRMLHIVSVDTGANKVHHFWTHWIFWLAAHNRSKVWIRSSQLIFWALALPRGMRSI